MNYIKMSGQCLPYKPQNLEEDKVLCDELRKQGARVIEKRLAKTKKGTFPTNGSPVECSEWWEELKEGRKKAKYAMTIMASEYEPMVKRLDRCKQKMLGLESKMKSQEEAINMLKMTLQAQEDENKRLRKCDEQNRLLKSDLQADEEEIMRLNLKRDSSEEEIKRLKLICNSSEKEIKRLNLICDSSEKEIKRLDLICDSNEEEINTLKLIRHSNEEEIKRLKLIRDASKKEIKRLNLICDSNKEEINTLKLIRHSNEEEINTLKLIRHSNEEEFNTLKLIRDSNEEEINTLKMKLEQMQILHDDLDDFIHLEPHNINYEFRKKTEKWVAIGVPQAYPPKARKGVMKEMTKRDSIVPSNSAQMERVLFELHEYVSKALGSGARLLSPYHISNPLYLLSIVNHAAQEYTDICIEQLSSYADMLSKAVATEKRKLEAERKNQCLNCGKKGHIKARCRRPGGGAEVGSNDCFRCGKHGHWARNCMM